MATLITPLSIVSRSAAAPVGDWVVALFAHTLPTKPTDMASASIPLFFFQAEDGIRHDHVTGVQTCALPISSTSGRQQRSRAPCESRAARSPKPGSRLE